MGLKRFSLLLVLSAVAAIVVVPGAGAGNFDEPRMGCPGETPGICAPGTEGVPYSMPIELLGDEDEACAVFTVSSGSLPPGLSVRSDEKVISGTPTQAGTYDFFLTVTYNREETCPFKNVSDDSFRLVINPGVPKLTIGPEQDAVPIGTVASVYSLQMTASVSDAKTWSIAGGALPDGVTLGASDGLISGTPLTAGTYTFTVRAEINAQRVDTKTLTITVRDPLAIAGSDPFTEARRALGEVSAPFDATLTASGGTGVYTWSLTSGTLPPGVFLANGSISGTPSIAGVYPFTASVTDNEGRVANYPSRIVVAEKLTISTLLLPPGKVGKLYGAKLRTFGGVRPASWRIVRGPLPRGVRFDRVLGQLFGVPKKPGRYRVTFEATDVLGVKAKKTFRIVVTAVPLRKSR